ncbi:MAG: hypothetical protein R3E68_19895 [Burkholderiaceae bacterium]
MNDLTSCMPPLRVSRWFNAPGPMTWDALRGRVVVVLGFQMLCPGCVDYALPQLVRLRQAFREDQVAVIGLHTVFEHHEVMGAQALQVFIHEYRLRVPIGVDQADPNDPVPMTMAWGLQGTPSLVILDRQARLHFKHFGRLEDIALGAVVGQLLAQAPEQNAVAPAPDDKAATDPVGTCQPGRSAKRVGVFAALLLSAAALACSCSAAALPAGQSPLRANGRNRPDRSAVNPVGLRHWSRLPGTPARRRARPPRHARRPSKRSPGRPRFRPGGFPEDIGDHQQTSGQAIRNKTTTSAILTPLQAGASWERMLFISRLIRSPSLVGVIQP